MELAPKLQTLLRERFGFASFRPGQLEALQTLFESGRLLCIQPTGHGKSLLYQLPSCLLDGLTLVISPLLALMRDQIDQLGRRFQIPAASINTDQTEEDNGKAASQAMQGQLRVLFVSPEQLDRIDRFDFILSLPLSLIVVDEAHCISTWGHDFRPSYRQILRLIQSAEQKRPGVKILGLTATAAERVEKDIERQLTSSGKKLSILRESMDRPNLHLSVYPMRGAASKLLTLEKLLASLDGCGLIYCSTRENTELVAEHLQRKQINAIAYHAGLEPEAKKQIQQAFLQDAYKVVAATNALGMGIDKPNLRFIIHFDIPGSITAYYQEVGRAGRDGQKAHGILLYDPSDRKVQEYFIDSALPTMQDFDQILDAVRNAVEPPNITTIKRLSGLHPTRVTIVVAELLEQQFLKKEMKKGSQIYSIEPREGKPDLARYEAQHTVKTQELQKILHYAEQTEECRMLLLRKALGDARATPCGHCDACLKMRSSFSLAASEVDSIARWLEEKPLPIAESRLYREGISLLDGKLHSPLFIRFMKQRQTAEEVDPELIALFQKQRFNELAALVPIPSRTWKGRDKMAAALSNLLHIPVLDCLEWREMPEKRQGELLNNDQRFHNVEEKMKVKASVLPKSLLLLDDYIGSGATMKEAARAIRAISKATVIVPLTLAAVKWRLGKAGFV